MAREAPTAFLFVSIAAMTGGVVLLKTLFDMVLAVVSLCRDLGVTVWERVRGQDRGRMDGWF